MKNWPQIKANKATIRIVKHCHFFTMIKNYPLKIIIDIDKLSENIMGNVD